jgi:DNA-binding beta-propeller fold protein YncE
MIAAVLAVSELYWNTRPAAVWPPLPKRRRKYRAISVLDTASFTVVATIAVQPGPISLAIDSAGTRVYVANSGSNRSRWWARRTTGPAFGTTFDAAREPRGYFFAAMRLRRAS